jgi:hypothetical protein
LFKADSFNKLSAHRKSFERKLVDVAGDGDNTAPLDPSQRDGCERVSVHSRGGSVSPEKVALINYEKASAGMILGVPGERLRVSSKEKWHMRETLMPGAASTLVTARKSGNRRIAKTFPYQTYDEFLR